MPSHSTQPAPARPTPYAVAKAATGIHAFDALTGGGIPRGRATAVYGTTGVGKTVFAMQALVNGARDGEPGVLLSFSETQAELRDNGRSLGLDIPTLEASGRLVVDSAFIDPDEVVPGGPSTLDGVFVRLEQAIERIGAKRVVIDAVNVLAQTMPHPAVARASLRRLLLGLKDRGVTTMLTVEGTPDAGSTPEEYLADCVIAMRSTVQKGITTRRLRVVKYRGSGHRVNAYPFVISPRGIVLTPVTLDAGQQPSSDEQVSVGIDGLDAMLSGGVFRGDTVLVTGSAGSGKTSVTVALAVAACRRGERCLFVAMEEPASQIVRNMRGVGIDLATWTDSGLLRMHSPRPDLEGLEANLAFIMEEVETFRPHVVVLDPLTPLMAKGEPEEVRETIIRLLTIVKARGITAACTLLAREQYLEEQNTPFASFVDGIILLRNVETDGRRSRTVAVLKARGIAHSGVVRRFSFTPDGIVVGDDAPDASAGEGGTAGDRKR